MPIFEQFPYTNLHELNLDWIIKVVKEWGATVEALDKKFDDLNDAFNDLKTFVETYFDNLDVQEEINNKLDDMAENGELILLLAPYLPFVTPEMYGAKKDGVTDDLTAFNLALASGRPVMCTSGTYFLSDKIVMPRSTTLSGEDRNNTILKFDTDKTGIQINHSIKLSDITINIAGEGTGIYMYTPDNYSYDLSSVVENIRINHYDNTVQGTAILLEAEKLAEGPEGAYNLSFRDIDIRNYIEYGIHLHNKAKLPNKNECWLTGINFTDVFMNSVRYAITSDWTDISLDNSVPTSGLAPCNGNITFTNVNAQYNEEVAEYYAKIYNAVSVTFDHCMAFDYWHLRYDHNKTQIRLNGDRRMCTVDLGLMPELAEPLNLYISYINSSGNFKTDFFGTVIQLKLSSDKNEVYNNTKQFISEGTLTPAEGVTNASGWVEKIGNVAMLFYTCKVNIETAYTAVDIATIPEGYRISRSITKAINPGYDNARAYLDIRENGKLQLSYTATGEHTIYIEETYLIK